MRMLERKDLSMALGDIWRMSECIMTQQDKALARGGNQIGVPDWTGHAACWCLSGCVGAWVLLSSALVSMAFTEI